ncbi:MAG: 16S rRNA (cytosine(1402)-N(4))-methyltransferase [Candidatus Taylorbacteria bacterium RIFCSPHIGHO2_01_FULL_46_22b]|uniref:Ribosomal RNA small subunit methyltransferase H n=1 Tax=Candidatus Taylorbacteria bacterium RIFCSPHIGHO2_01_FULL_46_22b TaxID=1802301 RepID=A0A1G2M3T4_9BACT|nr:MAG: 16S rRNA (cytosine(1402)-N(4))-methyltransferase [Candidatus Taylorbacteria bacterium RIFCSPHIGHO2_01_FULL_46_22b]
MTDPSSQKQVHTSVLLQQAIEGLNISAGGIFVDATVGSAGHSLAVCRAFGSSVRLIGLDADPERVRASGEVLKSAGCNAEVVHENFRNIDQVLLKLKVTSASAILFDLGLNSEQLGPTGRGFSFRYDEPLIMTFTQPTQETLTAREIVNQFDEEAIANIIYQNGEERYSRRIARAIVERRKIQPIETTAELAKIVAESVPRAYAHGRINPATKTFQALRIAVNDELNALSEGIAKSFTLLSSGGRLAVISFHSLEDRIVKQFFKSQAVAGLGNLITKKPLTPSLTETNENPRSRSAKLRIIEKI